MKVDVAEVRRTVMRDWLQCADCRMNLTWRLCPRWNRLSSAFLKGITWKVRPLRPDGNGTTRYSTVQTYLNLPSLPTPTIYLGHWMKVVSCKVRSSKSDIHWLISLARKALLDRPWTQQWHRVQLINYLYQATSLTSCFWTQICSVISPSSWCEFFLHPPPNSKSNCYYCMSQITNG